MQIRNKLSNGPLRACGKELFLVLHDVQAYVSCRGSVGFLPSAPLQGGESGWHRERASYLHLSSLTEQRLLFCQGLFYLPGTKGGTHHEHPSNRCRSRRLCSKRPIPQPARQHPFRESRGRPIGRPYKPSRKRPSALYVPGRACPAPTVHPTKTGASPPTVTLLFFFT